MYTIVFANRAKKDLRRHGRSGSFPLPKLEQAIDILREKGHLAMLFKDHALKGSLFGYREFHIAGDLLVLYRCYEEESVIMIDRIGTHTELFGI
jgi:mRNA interferase YafQ